MSFEIYMPSYTDDWGEQQPDRVFGTGETEAAAWHTARRRLCFTARYTWSRAARSGRSRHPTRPTRIRRK